MSLLSELTAWSTDGDVRVWQNPDEVPQASVILPGPHDGQVTRLAASGLNMDLAIFNLHGSAALWRRGLYWRLVRDDYPPAPWRAMICDADGNQTNAGPGKNHFLREEAETDGREYGLPEYQ